MPRVAFEVSLAVPEPAPGGAKNGSWSKVFRRPLEAVTAEEVAPLVHKIGESVDWIETSEAVDAAGALSWCCDDFRPRTLQSFHVIGWLTLQLIGLGFQVSLLQETQQHLAEFQRSMDEHCGIEHIGPGGFCIGPTWNMSLSQTLTFAPAPGEDDGGGFDFVVASDRTFGPFETRSNPATFLLGLEPLPPHRDARWRVDLLPGSPPVAQSMRPEPVSGAGADYRVISAPYSRGLTTWTGRVNLLSKTTEESRIRVSIIDSRLEHLDQVHKQKQCSFERSWANFSAKHDGVHRTVLLYTQFATKLCLLTSTVLVGMLLFRLYVRKASGNLLGRVIGLKFVGHDFPQQICIVAYLYGWYAKNGLRCQMCLFYPLHCETQSPLHWTNFLACLFTALSAVSNQLLIKAKTEGVEEFDEVFLWLFRFALFSASILPFTTATYLSPFWFYSDHIVLMLFMTAIPLMMGWLSVCCGWLLVVFKDEFEL